MRYGTALALFALSAASAHADIYTYSCKMKGRSLPLKIDGNRRELTWMGKTYKTTELQAGDQQACPRFGWRATRPGAKFDFCTATQGAADFVQDGTKVTCDQKL